MLFKKVPLEVSFCYFISKPWFLIASALCRSLVLVSLSAFFLLSCSNRQKPLFTQLSPSQTNIHFSNNLVDHDSLNILDYLYYYNGGGVATGDINNDGLPDIYFTANSYGHNKLYLNKGNFKFEDITGKAGVAGNADWCSGVTMADVNGDGWLDIYVCAVSQKLGLKGKNQLFINNKNSTFTDCAADYGLDFSGYSTQAVFFDYDHDGDLDCYVLNQSSHSVQTYGDTSLRRIPNTLAGDKLYRNDGNKSTIKFTDVTLQSGIYSSALGYGLGVAVSDLNNDGWEDIYVGNDFHENDYYYINNHNGSFTESGSTHFNHYSRFSMGNDIADYNNDGQLDVFTLDMLPSDERVLKTYSGGDDLDIYNYNIINNGYQNQFSKNCLQKNIGNGAGFSDVSLMNGIAATDWSWCPLFADYDNDGVKDLFVTNGIVKRPVDLDYMKFVSSPNVSRQLSNTNRLDKEALGKMPDGKAVNYLFKGVQNGPFIDKSKDWGITLPTYSNGAAYADLDNDGNLDLIVNNINNDAGIFQNTNGKAKHFISVSFNGNDHNTMGIGCKAYLFNKGKMQYQQLMLTRGFQSSTEPRLHFGLDKISAVDSILVVWPNQTYELLKNIKVNQSLIIHQKHAGGVFDYNTFFPKKSPLFTNITAEVNLPWKHRENDFTDFNQQYFIPHKISTSGPKLAVADVNGDGLDDFYACGAKDQGGTLFIQSKDGHFKADSTVFKSDAGCENTDALFFDADGDNDLDLYVVSGGNEFYGNNTMLSDRLYLNNGKGNFIKAEQALPAIYQNKSVVCAADIDHDGDVDLFIGVRANALAYGVPQTSYLLLNNGEGKFAIANNNIADLKNIGMVTSAAFADINNDGWQDLIVAGEWMPVSIYLNKNGKFQRQQNKQLNGLWQSLSINDTDGDGDIDIVAGNYGLNSKLHASNEAPLKVYVKDLDNNGRIDQLLTYSINNKEYTFLGKEELEKQLPLIKKDFLKYNDFAGKTVQEVFGEQLTGTKPLHSDTLASGVFKNDGKGNFHFEPFPGEVQESSIFSFLIDDVNHDGFKDIITAGNFFGLLPYEGRYDGNWGDILINQRNKNYTWLSPANSGWLTRGELRDIKKLKTVNSYIYVVARNNDSLLFFK